MSQVNWKWVISPVPTGAHSSFAYRSWPHAELKDSGDWVARLDAEDGRKYQSGDNKKSDLGFNLKVYVIHNGKFELLKKRVRSLKEAKELVARYYNTLTEKKND